MARASGRVPEDPWERPLGVIARVREVPRGVNTHACGGTRRRQKPRPFRDPRGGFLRSASVQKVQKILNDKPGFPCGVADPLSGAGGTGTGAGAGLVLLAPL